jgi:hypothetical protein
MRTALEVEMEGAAEELLIGVIVVAGRGLDESLTPKKRINRRNRRRIRRCCILASNRQKQIGNVIKITIMTLHLHCRLRGSVRADLLHRYMNLSLGPTSIGTEMGHFLLLNVLTRFNISTGIKRMGEHVFGHPWLEYIDRIQVRYMQVFGRNRFPKHQNLLVIKVKEDFVAVGIRPLSYDARFVEVCNTPDPKMPPSPQYNDFMIPCGCTQNPLRKIGKILQCCSCSEQMAQQYF